MEKAILRTLAYADVFDYPLTSGELYRFLIVDKNDSYSDFRRALTRIKTNDKRINTNGEYSFLQGRKEIVAVRKQRKAWSASKLKLAEKVAGILRLIPWVKLIGITGALAMNNSKKDDDLDLLIVTSKNRLWLTRLFSVFLVELIGKRRRPGDKKVKDKICLNMLLDESHLAIPEKERDLFSAHEVCQMKPLWEKERTYQKFLKANQWSQKFLPNWKP